MEINYYSNYSATKYLNARPDVAVLGATFSFLNALVSTGQLKPTYFKNSFFCCSLQCDPGAFVWRKRRLDTLDHRRGKKKNSWLLEPIFPGQENSNCLKMRASVFRVAVH